MWHPLLQQWNSAPVSSSQLHNLRWLILYPAISCTKGKPCTCWGVAGLEFRITSVEWLWKLDKTVNALVGKCTERFKKLHCSIKMLTRVTSRRWKSLLDFSRSWEAGVPRCPSHARHEASSDMRRHSGWDTSQDDRKFWLCGIKSIIYIFLHYYCHYPI